MLEKRQILKIFINYNYNKKNIEIQDVCVISYPSRLIQNSENLYLFVSD